MDEISDEQLISMAKEAAKKAYVPYSHFHVGSAVLSEDNYVYTGCNIENSSYGATNCAERTAIFKAVSEGKTEFRAIAVAGGKDKDFSQPCNPCGACLQVMSEFCDDDFKIILSDRVYTLGEFLPRRFEQDDKDSQDN